MYRLLTATAHFAVLYAHQEVRRFRHREIDVDHLLLGICQSEERTDRGPVHTILSRVALQPCIEAFHPPNSDPYNERLSFTTQTKEVLEHAHHLSVLHKHFYIGTEHLLLALTRSDAPVMTNLFNELDVSRDQVSTDIIALMSERAIAALTRPPLTVNNKFRHDVLSLIADDADQRHQVAEVLSTIVDSFDNRQLLIAGDILKRSR